MKLTQELTNLTSKISDLQLQVNKQNMTEFELKQRFNEISKSYDTEKNEIERLRLDNLEQKSKFEALNDEFKKERQHKKQLELELSRAKEEKHEFKDQINNFEKLLNEKRAKYESDKKQYENDIEEMKEQYGNEISELKEKLTKYRNNTNELNREQIKQLEADLTNEWKMKLGKALKQQEQKYERSSKELNEERNNLVKQLETLNEQLKGQREKINQVEISNEELRERVDDLNIVEEKFKRLQSQALLMKERYETRIKELMDAEPDSEVLNEYVKKCMNTIFQKLKAQISLKNNYSGEGVLHAMLKLIKFVTIKIMKPKSDDDEEEEDDNEENYFSEHVVDFDEKLEDQRVGYEDKISKLKEEFSTRQQLASLQHESQIKSMEVKIEGLNREIEKQKEINIKNEEIQFKSQSIVQTIRPETPPPQPLPQIERRSSSPIILEKEVIIENKQEVEPIAVQETFTDEIEQENHEEENKVEIFITEERPKSPEAEEKQEERPKTPEVEEKQEETPKDEKVESFVELKNDENYSSIYDVPADDDFKIEEDKENEEDVEEDDLFKPKPPPNTEEKKEIKKKSILFDDDEDDDDMFLFSKSKPTTESTIKEEKPKSDNKEVEKPKVR